MYRIRFKEKCIVTDKRCVGVITTLRCNWYNAYATEGYITCTTTGGQFMLIPMEKLIKIEVVK